uniref:Candidate secreted effector n=1 Tax=Meloidogyne incognita TaxID=6306 RepID=A0A914KXV7_MELIC
MSTKIFKLIQLFLFFVFIIKIVNCGNCGCYKGNTTLEDDNNAGGVEEQNIGQHQAAENPLDPNQEEGNVENVEEGHEEEEDGDEEEEEDGDEEEEEDGDEEGNEDEEEEEEEEEDLGLGQALDNFEEGLDEMSGNTSPGLASGGDSTSSTN